MENARTTFVRRVAGPNASGLSLAELETLVSDVVADVYARNGASPFRRDPAEGKVCYTVFNLARPVTRWLDHLRTPDGILLGHGARRRLLTRLIAEHLRLCDRTRPLYRR
jgi:hypothetical protein